MSALTQWYIKNFKRKEAIRIYVAYPDHRVKHYWAIPDSTGTVSIGNFEFIIKRDPKEEQQPFLLQNNIPTYFFNTENPGPVNIRTGKQCLNTPQEIKEAIKSPVIRQLIESLDTGKFSMEGIITLVIITVGLGLVWYMLDQKVTAILQRVGEIIEALSSIGVTS